MKDIIADEPKNEQAASSAIETIVIWLKTIGNPEKRCELLGHKMKTRSLRVRKEGGGFRAVVTDYKAKETYCKRCYKGLDELHDLEEIKYYTGCTMPSDMWDEMRENGWVEIY